MVRCAVKREPNVILDPSSQVRGREPAWIICAAVGSSYSVDVGEFCGFVGRVCGSQEVLGSQGPDEVSFFSVETLRLRIKEDGRGARGAGLGELYAPSDVCCPNDVEGMGMEILTRDVFEIECELGRIGEGGDKPCMGRLLRFERLPRP